MGTTKLNTDRQGLEVLSHRTCQSLLAHQVVGRIAVVDANGVPLIFPVNYLWHAGRIAFRTAPGSKLDAAGGRPPASFEIDGFHERKGNGWSVLVTGRIEEVTAELEREALERLDLRVWAHGVSRDHWIRLIPARISGRRLL